MWSTLEGIGRLSAAISPAFPPIWANQKTLNFIFPFPPKWTNCNILNLFFPPEQQNRLVLFLNKERAMISCSKLEYIVPIEEKIDIDQVYSHLGPVVGH